MTQHEFISKVAPAAVEDMRVHKVPASLTIAQAILESSWGTSELATKAFNLFGIKGYGPAGTYAKVSDEYIDGEKTQKESNFKKYRSWAESISDHTTFLLKPRYAKAIGSDWKTACKEIHAAGYATDPAYPEKLMRLIEQYKLFEYDQVGEKEMSVPILIIDPGHGGVDPGAVGNDLKEKDLTLQISNYQYARFKALNVPVVLTRTTDVSLSSDQRTKIVKDSGAKYCLSNHINAGGGQGVETIHSIHSDSKLAKAIYDAIVKEGQIGRRVYSKAHSPQNPRLDYYYMHRETGSVETIITEYGFIDNAADAQKLKDKWQTYAEAVVKAFCAFLGMPYTAPNTHPQNPVNPVDKPIDKQADAKTQAALKVLQEKGVIQSPDYWMQNAFSGGQVRGDFAALLIQNMANKLNGASQPSKPTPTPEPKPDPKPEEPAPSKEPKDWKTIEEATKAASVYVNLLTDGTAVVLKDGYLLTAQHVSKGKDQLEVKTKDKRMYRAKKVDEHPGIGNDKVDLALYRLEDAPANLPYLPLATTKLQLGEKLLTVEAEYTKQTVRTGEVCVLSNKTWPWEFAASVPVDDGNSGGAAVNQYGELIGIAIQYEYVTVTKGSVSQGVSGGCFINLLYPAVADWIKQNVK